jgi:Tol biopolymer transport system component
VKRSRLICGTTICAINQDGTNLVQLAPAGLYASTAIFSPVGGDIAFLAGGLKVLRADGSIVGVAPGIAATKPTWSPDGRTLAFVMPATWSPGGACNADGSPCARTPDYTYAVEADGSGLRMLAYGTNPAWFVPPPGQPAAAFTTACTGRACQFNGAGSFDPDGTIVSSLCICDRELEVLS